MSAEMVGVCFIQEEDGNIVATKLVRGGAAERDGRIAVADILCAVDGTDVIGQPIEIVRGKISRYERALEKVSLMLARIVPDPPPGKSSLPAGCTLHRDDVMGCFITYQVSLSRDSVPQGGDRDIVSSRRGRLNDRERTSHAYMSPHNLETMLMHGCSLFPASTTQLSPDTYRDC
jgi:hypothetical protein